MTTDAIYKIVASYVQKWRALGARISPHALRATFITLALDGHAPLHKVQYAVGHADPRTTERYHTTKANIEDAAGDYFTLDAPNRDTMPPKGALAARIGPYLAYDLAPDGANEYMVLPQLRDQAAIRTGPTGADHYTEEWMYGSVVDALIAYHAWERAPGTAPQGWTRHTTLAREIEYHHAQKDGPQP